MGWVKDYSGCHEDSSLQTDSKSERGQYEGAAAADRELRDCWHVKLEKSGVNPSRDASLVVLQTTRSRKKEGWNVP